MELSQRKLFAMTVFVTVSVSGIITTAAPSTGAPTDVFVNIGSPSQSMHKLPNRGISGVRYQCGPDAGYACTMGGYGAASAKASGWPWSYYGGPYASYNIFGAHNCTLYAALDRKSTRLN